MRAESVALGDLLHETGIDQAELLQVAVEETLQTLMEAEVQSQGGADRYERTANRATHRNGHRDREWETRLGTVYLQIPNLRRGTYFSAFLEPCQRIKQALTAVIQDAYVFGVSARKVDELVQALGMRGLKSSAVSALCAELDEGVTAFPQRPRLPAPIHTFGWTPST